MQFDNWIFGPEKFTGLSRNVPQVWILAEVCWHDAILLYSGGDSKITRAHQLPFVAEISQKIQTRSKLAAIET